MKILTTNLKDYKKVFEIVKQSGTRLYESVYLDAENDRIVFMNDNTVVQIAATMEKDEGEQVEPFFVDGVKFFFLVESYDILNVKGTTFFSPTGDKFALPSFKEDIELPDFGGEGSWTSVPMNFSEQLQLDFKTALDYVEPGETEYSSLFFEGKKMLTLSKTKFFQTSLENSVKSFNIPHYFVRLLAVMNLEGKGEFRYKSINDAFRVFFKMRDLEVVLSTSSSNSLPIDPESSEFREAFYHDEWVQLPVRSTLESIKFLSSLTGEPTTTHVRLSFGGEGEDSHMMFGIQNESDISYKTPVEKFSDPSYFEENELWISLDSLRRALSHFGMRKILSVIVRFEEGAPAIYFADKKELEEGASDFFIVQTLLENPTE